MNKIRIDVHFLPSGYRPDGLHRHPPFKLFCGEVATAEELVTACTKKATEVLDVKQRRSGKFVFDLNPLMHKEHIDFKRHGLEWGGVQATGLTFKQFLKKHSTLLFE